MKKVFLIISIFFTMFATTCLGVWADAKWDNPKSIRTYIPQHSKRELMKQAFAQWTKFTNGKIIFKYVSDPKNAQIKVKFVKDIYDVTGNKTTIGQTYHESMGSKMISAVITISDRSPNGAAFKKDAVYRVMVHEIGHALGIFGHSQDPKSVMYYARINRHQHLTEDDLKYIGKLYGWN